VKIFLKRFVSLVLLVADLNTRGRHGRRACQPTFADQSLGLTRIGFVLDPVITPGNDTIQSTSLLGIVGSGPKARTNRNLVFGGDAAFKPIQGVCGAAGREIVSMHGARYSTFLMPEDVGTRNALLESHPDECGAILLLPTIGGRSRAVHVSEELSALLSTIGVFRRQVDEARLGFTINLGVEVSSLYINETHLHPLCRARIIYGAMIAACRHRHTDHGPERFQRRGGRKVRLPGEIGGLQLSRDES